MNDVPEAVRPFVVSVVFWRLWILDVTLPVDVSEQHDPAEALVGPQADVRETRGLALPVGAAVDSGVFVVELVLAHGVALRRIADAYAADVREVFVIRRGRRLALLEAAMDATHHLAADHAYLVENNEARLAQVVL